jgi:two-component system chemotaxis response regulator CheB
LIRFRRRTGHACAAGSVLDEEREALENALYAAMNTLEESALMVDRLAARSHEQQHEHAAVRLEKRAHEAYQRAETKRRVFVGAEHGAEELAS